MAEKQLVRCSVYGVGVVSGIFVHCRPCLILLSRYNPNTNIFYLYTTLFENRLAGGISSETFRALNLERFSASDAWSIAIVSGVEVFLFAYVLFYIVIEARNIRRLGIGAWLTDGYSLLMYCF
jgi:hypothetical protein